jgi:hypothetical protein
MIRSTMQIQLIRGIARRFRRRRTSKSVIPFDMFDEVRTAREMNKAKKLENIYHKGQNKAWDGREVLESLVEKHGGIQVDPEQVAPLRELLSVLLWGELAAWKISADLACQLAPLEAKMAATSQAHDEARHFYVLHDYLEMLDYAPARLGPAAERVFSGTLTADTLAKKLFGMQLMIEPMALTVFQALREKNVDPVLTELLSYYERDEARHVALGVMHLPKLLKSMSLVGGMDLWQWEFREFWCQLNLLHELEPHLDALGLDMADVVDLGFKKQARANMILMEELGYDIQILYGFLRFFAAKAEWDFPKACSRDEWKKRAKGAWEAGKRGFECVPKDALSVKAAS